jgi:hypothetical protein
MDLEENNKQIYTQVMVCVFITCLIVAYEPDWSFFLNLCNAFMGLLTFVVVLVISSVIFHD